MNVKSKHLREKRIAFSVRDLSYLLGLFKLLIEFEINLCARFDDDNVLFPFVCGNEMIFFIYYQKQNVIFFVFNLMKMDRETKLYLSFFHSIIAASSVVKKSVENKLK